MKIRFNVQETIQKEYELDLADSEKVFRRAEEIKNECAEECDIASFYYLCAIQELLDENEINAILVDEETDTDFISAWEHNEED